EAGVIQAFRLGASDYIAWPAREPEILSVAERVLKQGRERRERQKLDQQLKQTNEELQRRVRELTTIFSIGRAVLSITDQRLLFDKLVEASLSVTLADMGWLLIRDEKTKQFLLASSQKLPEGWAKKLNQPFDDGVSGLVALSGETLSINGAPIKQFKVATLGQSVLVVPIKVQGQVIGLLTTLRKADKPFGKSEQTLLEAVADYASISMVNAQLFRALSQAAEAAQSGEKRKVESLGNLRQQLNAQVQAAGYPLDMMLSGRLGAFTPEQLQALRSIQTALKQIYTLANQPNTQPVNPQAK
ncbi:MAG: GAF domain-containing protein, partial [Anaerolineales bacterium]